MFTSRGDIDNGGTNEKVERIDASFAGDFFLVDTLKAHRQNCGHAIEEIDPDDAPDPVEDGSPFRLRGDEFSDEQ